MFDDAEAAEGLRRSEERLRDYADSRGLVLREESPWPGYVPASQQQGPIRHAIWSLAGELPGGAVGRLRHQAVFGNVPGAKVAGQHTIMVCRIPESVGYVPMLCIRPDQLGSGLYHWGGDSRPRQSQRFESVELERRYVVEVAPGQSQLWIYQLFSPTFIDWLASSTPPDFGCKLDLGVFTCETPQWRGQPESLSGEVEPAALDRLLESGGRVASRIRDEVLEEAGVMAGEPAEADSAAAYAEWANRPKHGRIVGTIMRVFRLSEGDDGIGKYAGDRGLEVESPAAFHTRYIGLAMPGAATGVATGTLPGGERSGSLAWLEFSSDVDIQHEYVAAAMPIDASPRAAWFDPDDVGVPGAGDDLPGTVRERCAAAGYGIALKPGAVCVYVRTGGTTPGAAIDAFAADAQEIAAAVEAEAATAPSP